MRDLERREADLALSNIPPERGDLVWRRVGEVSVGVYASPDYVASLSDPPDVRTLQWVTYSPELAHIPQARFVTEMLAGRPAAFTSNSFLAMRAAAQHGVGPAASPDQVALR